jgi:tetratricopeptide (TPR) repeat protein
VKAFPRKADLQCAYGATLTAVGNHQKACLYFRKALELDPNYLIAQYNLSQGLMYLGQTEAAIAGFRRALEIEPLCAPAYQQLARLCRFTEYNEDIHIMEQLYEQLRGNDRKLLAFGLFAAHQKLGNDDLAFSYLLEGNRLERENHDYRREQTVATFRELREAFTPDVLANRMVPFEHPLTPIIIIGMPRSGTSLAEQILASHSQVHGCGELKNLNLLYHSVFTSRSHLGTQVRALTMDKRQQMARRYLDELAAMAGGKPFATDKMPHNFLHVGLIAYLMPNARIIHCERNPMDTCFSIFTNLFTGVHGYGYNLEELGDYYLQYRDLMAYWEQVLPGRMYPLNYERVVDDTETEVRKLLDFCGLPFEDNCLSFFDNDRAVTTVSSTQVRQPIYKSSVESWRRYEQGLEPLRAILES